MLPIVLTWKVYHAMFRMRMDQEIVIPTIRVYIHLQIGLAVCAVPTVVCCFTTLVVVTCELLVHLSFCEPMNFL